MVKAIVVYESKYGNTRLVAEKIIEGMRQVSGVEATLAEIGDVTLDRIPEFDAILIGTPNHIGRATRSIGKFIDKLGKLNMEGKKAAVFDTCVRGDFEKAVKKMEKQISEKVPQLEQVASGLSIRVDGMKGPITEGELPGCEEFGAKIAALISK